MEKQQEALSTIENLSLRYGERTVLAEINMELFRGRISALLGPSGSGKSTLLYALADILPPGAHVSGRIYRKRPERIVGIVFQRPLPFPLSIFENVALALRERGFRKPEEQVAKALTQAGLWDEVKDRLHEAAATLSGGQQQRLCLARVLALEPELLLLDEPCSSLDPLATQAIEASLRDLSASTAILIVTHNIAQAARLASETLVLWPNPDGSRIVDRGKLHFLAANSDNTLVRSYLSGRIG